MATKGIQITISGFVWYRNEADYKACLAIFEDSEKLPGTYQEWLEKAEYGLRQMKASGARVVKAHIDPGEFPEWCRSRGLNVDANGRTAWGNEVAMRHVRSQG